MSDIITLDDIQKGKDGDYLSGGGECCGFDAWIEGKIIKCNDRACGIGTIWEGEITLKEAVDTASKINLENLQFNDVGEAMVHIKDNVYFTFDKYEMDIVPGIFHLKRA